MQRKKTIVGMALAAALVMVSVTSLVSAQRSVRPSPLKGMRIVVDAGHGGMDCGTIGRVQGLREDKINLAVARALQKLLASAEVDVIMTRDSDEGLNDPETRGIEQKREDMRRRAQIIKESQADMVVSIHMNGFPQGSPHGAQVLYQKGSDSGKALAECLQQELIAGLDPANRRVATGGNYMVLRASSAPAVLVECGFLSNPEEEEKLSQPRYQEKIAWHIYTGMTRYAAQNAQETTF
nr:N-acetylmuramoyl-L-alanine amidase [Maliibacterium massiliense]